jgi:heptosyltransferase II
LDFELSSERTLDPGKIRRVVVRGTNWIGDAVLTMPALRELRRVLPDAHITLATRSSTRALFDEADFIDDVLIYDQTRPVVGAVLKQIREWRSRKFDLAVLFQNAFEAALIGLCARIRARIGYDVQGRRMLLTHPVKLPEWRSRRHEVFYYLNIVSELETILYGKSEVNNHEPIVGMTVSESRRLDARQLLFESGTNTDHYIVALCPGSTNSRAKRWPAERFAALADKIIGELKIGVVLVGSKNEIDVSNEVAALMKTRPTILTGHTNLAEAVAVLSVSDVIVTNDTGPAHIASALGRPTLVIFGPTNPETTRPFSKTAEVIRHPPDCAPCMLRDCPIDHRCMTAISPDEVFSRVKSLLYDKQVGVEG